MVCAGAGDVRGAPGSSGSQALALNGIPSGKLKEGRGVAAVFMCWARLCLCVPLRGWGAVSLLWSAVPGAAGFFLFYLRSRGRAGFVDKCWCVRSSGAFAPHPPLFFVCVSRGRICGDTKKRRRGGVLGVGVGCFEALMLRYRGMSAPRVLMGCRKGFLAGFL